LGGLLQRPNGEAKRGLTSLKNSSTAKASILRPRASTPMEAPASPNATRATSAQNATWERSLKALPAKSVIWPQPTRMGVRGSII